MKSLNINTLQYFMMCFCFFSLIVGCSTDSKSKENLKESNSQEDLVANRESEALMIINKGESLVEEINELSLYDMESLNQEVINSLAQTIGYEAGEIQLEFVSTALGEINYFNENGIEAGMLKNGFAPEMTNILMYVINNNGINDLNSIEEFNFLSNENKKFIQIVNEIAIIKFGENGANQRPMGDGEGAFWGSFLGGMTAGAVIGGPGGMVVGGIIGFAVGMVWSGSKAQEKMGNSRSFLNLQLDSSLLSYFMYDKKIICYA